MRKKFVIVAALAAAIMSMSMNSYAMEVHINSVEKKGNFQLVDSIVYVDDDLLNINTHDAVAIYVRTTGYTGIQGYVGKTASGTVVHEGTLAGPKEWLGRECYLIDTDGNVIGEYIFEDTGNPKYVNDTRIDIWFPSDAELNAYQKTVGDYALIVFK